jgi:hypothetical protein
MLQAQSAWNLAYPIYVAAKAAAAAATQAKDEAVSR